ncbi:MAG: tetratricopeptide repeat protein [Acidobacteriota bacterium]
MPRHAFLTMILLLAACAVMAPSRAQTADDQRQPARLEMAQTDETQGDAARARENYYSAAWYYRKALKNDRKNATLYNKLGLVQLKVGNYRGAHDSFRRAIKLDSHNPHFYNNLGALYCLQKKYKPAVEELKRALALNESMAAAHMNMAEAWMGRGDANRAMTEYARAIELDPDILDSSRSGVIAQIATPEQRAWVNYLIAKAYAKHGNIENALEYLQRAKDGDFPNLHKVYDEEEFAALWPDPRLEKIVKR